MRSMFFRNGAMYLNRRECLVTGSFKGNDCRALVMPGTRSTNIDTADDVQYAEWLIASGTVPPWQPTPTAG